MGTVQGDCLFLRQRVFRARGIARSVVSSERRVSLHLPRYLAGCQISPTSKGLRVVLERKCSPLLIVIFPGAVITSVLMPVLLEWLVTSWDVVLLGAV